MALIPILLGAGLFSFVLFSIVLLIIAAIVIIICRIVKQKKVRKYRLILECDDDTGVEMGNPLVVEEFGVSVSV